LKTSQHLYIEKVVLLIGRNTHEIEKTMHRNYRKDMRVFIFNMHEPLIIGTR